MISEKEVLPANYSDRGDVKSELSVWNSSPAQGQQGTKSEKTAFSE